MVDALTVNKIGALFVFFGTSFIGVFLPYFIPIKPLLLKMGLLLASGLFLALAFLHLMVDSVEVFEEMYQGDYPLAYLLIPLGFYMTWLADLGAGAIWARLKRPAPKLEADMEKTKEHAPSRRVSCCKSETQLLEAESKCQGSQCPCTSEATCQCAAELMYPEGDAQTSMEGPTVTGALATLGGGDGEDGQPTKLPLLDVILLLIALCFHAFFEGLAVGLATTIGGVWQMTAAICINEVFEGAALGSTLRAQDAKRHIGSFLLYAVGASVVAPTGVFVGIILATTTTPEAAEWAEGVGLGLAAGVFICIATRHLIAKAMLPDGPNEPIWMPFLKFFVSGLGLAINALLTLMPEEVASSAMSPAPAPSPMMAGR